MRAQLDEVGALQGRGGEQDPVVGDDPDGVAVQVGEAGHQGLAVERLELVEAAAVDEPRDHLADLQRTAEVGRDRGVKVGLAGRLVTLRRHRRRLRASPIPGRIRRTPVEVRHDRATEREGMLVIERLVVGDPADPGMNTGAAEVFRADILAGSGLHQGRAAEEDRAGTADDDGFIAHGRNVGAAGGRRAHDQGDLGDAGRRQAGLVVEDPAEVVTVREDIGLERQVGAAAVDQVDARQPILERDLLGPEVLLDCDREVRPALDRGVVGHDHAGRALDPGDPGDDPRARRLVVVHAAGGQWAELEEGGARVDQPVDPLTDRQLATSPVAGDRRVIAAGVSAGDANLSLSQVGDQGRHRVDVLAGALAGGIEPAAEDGHGRMIPAPDRRSANASVGRLHLKRERRRAPHRSSDAGTRTPRPGQPRARPGASR